MTTQTDDELRDILLLYANHIEGVPGVAKNDIHKTMQLIQADRKARETEIRIDTLDEIDRRVKEDESKGKFASRSKYIRDMRAELEAARKGESDG